MTILKTVIHKYAPILLLCVISLSSCIMTVEDFGGKSVSFTDLPKEVQDTVLYWVENDKWITFTVPGDSTQYQEDYYPYIICFDEQYTLKSEEFGPWTKNKLLTRISDGKRYKLARNAPIPVIVRNDTIYIPEEYNILTVWDPSVKWMMYKLR